MERVISYDTFGLLHCGHISLPRRTKALGDYLVVALSTDELNWSKKQKRCHCSYEDCKQLLETIHYVDLVIPRRDGNRRGPTSTGAPYVCSRDTPTFKTLAPPLNAPCSRQDAGAAPPRPP